MFQNVIMPEVTVSEMRGVLALLALIGNPQAQAAAEFLGKLSAEKDAAVEAAKQAASDRAAAEDLAREMPNLKLRDQLLSERELKLAEGLAELERDRAEYNAALQALKDLARPMLAVSAAKSV
jgi:hypothetical protein